jgi:hypothetical protein
MTKQSKIIYSQEFKDEVLEYEKTHTIRETCEKFNVSKFSINKWKGWTRKNVSESNRKWYETKGKEYYSKEENKLAHLDTGRRYRSNNTQLCRDRVREYANKCRFRKLSEYANRSFKRKGKKDYHILTAWELWKIAKAQKLICPLSGYKLTKDNLSVDHILAISKGGSNHPSNIRLVDKQVNLMLHTNTDKSFFKICLDIVQYNGLR